jgi:hypothetical protein
VRLERDYPSGMGQRIDELNMIYDNSNHMLEHAAAWLTERGDLRELHEQRLETAEWAILIFVVVSVILDLLILITHA